MELWRLEHALEPVPMAGWLILKPLRHAESFAELTADEAAAFGPLLLRTTRAMTEVLSPAKVYVCLYAESASAPHIHFHLIPRSPDLAPERRGPAVFECMRQASEQGDQADLALVERMVGAIRGRIQQP